MNIKKMEYENFTILRIYERNDQIGSVEIIVKKCYTYIENVYLNVQYRHKGYLKKIIKYLQSYGKLICIPLPQHVEKFKHYGFSFYEQKGEDIYYALG